MQNFKIRKIIPEDMKQIRDLLHTREELSPDAAEQRTRLHEWIAFGNPSANGKATYYVAEDEGKIVAFHGRMPVEFIVKGKPVVGYFVHDLYVHPETRKAGKGFWLTLKLARAIEQDSDSFFMLLGMTPLNYQMQKRFGYYETFVDGFIRVLDPTFNINKHLKIGFISAILGLAGKISLNLYDAFFTPKIPADIKIRTVKKFDERFDKLNEQLKSKFGVYSSKYASYMNWKYIDRPTPRDTVFAAETDGELRGWIVVAPGIKKDRRAGCIMEMLCDPNDKETINALLRKTLDHFKAENMEYVFCLMSDARYVKGLNRFKFLKRELAGKILLIGNLKHVADQEEILKNINSWHFTRGESDGFMLNPGE